MIGELFWALFQPYFSFYVTTRMTLSSPLNMIQGGVGHLWNHWWTRMY